MSFQCSVRTLRFTAIAIVMALLASLQSAFAAGGAVWTGAYYNNEFLTGSPALVRTDGDVAFNWGTGSPADGINADHFSVRWATDVYFEAGTYRFSVVADDNVYLRVDNPAQPQINTFSSPAVGQTVSADVTLTAGVHHIQLDYQELTGSANVFLTWANLGGNPSAPTPVPSSGGSGPWTGQYYSNIDFYGSPVYVASEATVSHDWGNGSPAPNIPVDNFSARWIASLTLADGTYQINARADDGIRVYIDGLLSVNEWHASSGTTYTITRSLTAGQHSFQVDYYESGGLAMLDFSMTPIVNNPSPSVPVNSPAVNSTGRVNINARVNVRSEPNASAVILTKIRSTHTYPIIGRTADSSWWQINVDGTVGWVYWRYMDVTNPQSVSVTAGSSAPSNPGPATGILVIPVTNVNMRSGPGTSTAIIGRIPQGTQVAVVGRNAANTWWQVNDGRTTGWISARYAPLPAGISADSITVTG